MRTNAADDSRNNDDGAGGRDRSCAIVYRSRYGSTEQYARWIAEEADADLFDLRHGRVRPEYLLRYDTLVFGGGIYATGILGIGFLKKNFKSFSGKRLIVFSVGAAMPTEKNLAEVVRANFTSEIEERVRYFHLRGGLDYPAMRTLDRLLMWMLKKKIEFTPEEKRDSEEQGILATYGMRVSFLDRATIAPIVTAIAEPPR